MITQATKDESCNNPGSEKDSGPGPGSRISMDNDTDEETERLREKEEGEETDKKKMRSDSPESVYDAPDDEGFKGGDENSTKSESVGYAKVRKGERSKHNAGKGLVEKNLSGNLPR